MKPLKRNTALVITTYTSTLFLYAPQAFAAGANDAATSSVASLAPVVFVGAGAAVVAGCVVFGLHHHRQKKAESEYHNYRMQMVLTGGGEPDDPDPGEPMARHKSSRKHKGHAAGKIKNVSKTTDRAAAESSAAEIGQGQNPAHAAGGAHLGAHMRGDSSDAPSGVGRHVRVSDAQDSDSDKSKTNLSGITHISSQSPFGAGSHQMTTDQMLEMTDSIHKTFADSREIGMQIAANAPELANTLGEAHLSLVPKINTNDNSGRQPMGDFDTIPEKAARQMAFESLGADSSPAAASSRKYSPSHLKVKAVDMPAVANVASSEKARPAAVTADAPLPAIAPRSSISPISTGEFLANIESKYGDMLRLPFVARAVSDFAAQPVQSPAKTAPSVQNNSSSPEILARIPKVMADDSRVFTKESDFYEISAEEAKKLEQLELEIQEAGKAAQRATSQAARSSRVAGEHALQIMAERVETAKPVVPIRRGPGFVDVKDSTFVRNDLGDAISSWSGKISLTDSISDFRYSELTKTYYTQGDMVQVEYPSANKAHRLQGSKPDISVASKSKEATMAGAKAVAQAATLTALPLI